MPLLALHIGLQGTFTCYSHAHQKKGYFKDIQICRASEWGVSFHNIPKTKLSDTFLFIHRLWAYLILNLKQVDEKDDRKVQRGLKEGSWRKRPTSALGSRGTTVSQPGSRRLSRACLSGNGEPGLGSRSWSKERPLATKVREEVWSQGLNVFASFSLVEEGFFLYTVYL